MAVIGLLVFNVILLVLSIININHFYTICMCVFEYVCMSVCLCDSLKGFIQYFGFIKRGLTGLEQLL